MIQRVILAEYEKIVAGNDQVPSDKKNYQETENSIIVPPPVQCQEQNGGIAGSGFGGDREH